VYSSLLQEISSVGKAPNRMELGLAFFGYSLSEVMRVLIATQRFLHCTLESLD
jgi:hypothetical protein